METLPASIDKLTETPALTALGLFLLSAATIVYLIKRKRSHSSGVPFKQPAGMPRIPTNLQRAPNQKIGGNRAVDNAKIDTKTKHIRETAVQLAKNKKFLEAAKLLEKNELLRDAIDLLEANKLFDEAASMLMTINRPNRAAVIYERNQCFEKATLFFLRAKLVDDAKRCLKQINQLDTRLISELSVLFAEADDKKSALNLLLKIGDKERILKMSRETFAYKELAQLLDQSHTRELVLSAMSISDIDHMLENMPEDDISPLKRAQVWLNESCKGEWVVSVFRFIGNQRGLAQSFAESLNTTVIQNFVAYCKRLNDDYVSKHREQLEWTARALHDAAHWRASAIAFELLGIPLLAAKGRALSGDLETARQLLVLPNGDSQLAKQFDAAVRQLGIENQPEKGLSDGDAAVLQRVFFSVDPDNEINRTASPFSFAV